MTIIAVSGRVMVADSYCFAGGVGQPVAFPKIARSGKGLIGISGKLVDCHSVGLWFAAGEIDADQPRGLQTGEGGIGALILRPDGTAWYMDECLRPAPHSNPGAVGTSGAASFCEGLLAAGMDIDAAVRLTIDRCANVGGPVQVERLDA